MINFCTLFDSNYLDKGLALYSSLKSVSEDFHLYIFCFDDTSYFVLNQLKLKETTIIHHSAIEDDQLLALKNERSKAEYCWTCTPVIIEYVLNFYKVENCTYIDADLFFFSDPQVLFDEIYESKSDIVITEHRFRNNWNGRRKLRKSGKYCVEFNFFNQSKNARAALTWWKERCFEWCYHIYEPDRMGDQKYLEKFPLLFKGVHELQYLGGGVAPWNLNQYELDNSTSMKIQLCNKSNNKKFKLVFYHFQNLRYLNENKVNANSGTHSKEIKDAIYIPYLIAVDNERLLLKDYGVNFSIKTSYSSNKLIEYLQKNIFQYKIKSISDIYDLNVIRKMR